MTDIRKMVFANLNDAMDNGYDISRWSGNDIVTDLKCFASDCEDVDANILLKHVLEWKREPSKRCN